MAMAVGLAKLDLTSGNTEFSLLLRDLPHSLYSKESACSEEGLGSIPGSGRSPGEENGYSLQYFCLENFIDRGAWRATIHGIPKSRT